MNNSTYDQMNHMLAFLVTCTAYQRKNHPISLKIGGDMITSRITTMSRVAIMRCCCVFGGRQENVIRLGQTARRSVMNSLGTSNIPAYESFYRRCSPSNKTLWTQGYIWRSDATKNNVIARRVGHRCWRLHAELIDGVASRLFSLQQHGSLPMTRQHQTATTTIRVERQVFWIDGLRLLHHHLTLDERRHRGKAFKKRGTSFVVKSDQHFQFHRRLDGKSVDLCARWLFRVLLYSFLFLNIENERLWQWCYQ